MSKALVAQEIGVTLSVKDHFSSLTFMNDLESETSQYRCTDLQHSIDQWQNDVDVFKQRVNTLLDDSLGRLIPTTSAS